MKAMTESSPYIQFFLTFEFFFTLILSIALVPLLRRPAKYLGLVNKPRGKLNNFAPTPLIGGPLIFISLVISLYFWQAPSEMTGMLFAASILFFIGLIDDKYDISAKFRLFAQALLVFTAFWWDNNWITEITLTKDLIIDLGSFCYIISVIAVLGIMNAINMLDGIDGLSSGVVLIVLAFLLGLSITAGQLELASIIVCIFASVLGFWLFNYRFVWRKKASIYMGDSGTTLLGFILPYLAITLSNVTPVEAPKSLLLWLFAIPIWDIFAVIIKRFREGISPLKARRDHIHHEFLRAGLSVRQSLHLVYLLTIATVSLGFSLQLFSFTRIESTLVFTFFMFVYLGRVGSLSVNAEIYSHDFNDKRSKHHQKNETSELVNLANHSKRKANKRI